MKRYVRYLEKNEAVFFQAIVPPTNFYRYMNRRRLLNSRKNEQEAFNESKKKTVLTPLSFKLLQRRNKEGGKN